jgi:hypothetical protein
LLNIRITVDICCYIWRKTHGLIPAYYNFFSILSAVVANDLQNYRLSLASVNTVQCAQYNLNGKSEPVFVDLLRRSGIDSQPGGPVRNPICRTGPPDYIGSRNRFLRIESWAP